MVAFHEDSTFETPQPVNNRPLRHTDKVKTKLVEISLHPLRGSKPIYNDSKTFQIVIAGADLTSLKTIHQVIADSQNQEGWCASDPTALNAYILNREPPGAALAQKSRKLFLMKDFAAKNPTHISDVNGVFVFAGGFNRIEVLDTATKAAIEQLYEPVLNGYLEKVSNYPEGRSKPKVPTKPKTAPKELVFKFLTASQVIAEEALAEFLKNSTNRDEAEKKFPIQPYINTGGNCYPAQVIISGSQKMSLKEVRALLMRKLLS